MERQEQKRERQLALRRAACRSNQVQYHSRQKLKAETVNEKTPELKELITNQSLYHSLLLQSSHLHPYGQAQFRMLALKLYADYFKYSIETESLKKRQKQNIFLKFHFHPQMVFKSERYRIGLPFLIQQHELYVNVYDDMCYSSSQVWPAEDRDVFKLSWTATGIICQRTIKALYPHMLVDFDFMEKVVGESISFQVNQTLHFDANHQVVYFSVEQKAADGWCVLLKDVQLAAKVVSQQNLDLGFYITAAS